MGELNTMSINFLDPEKCKFYLNPNGFAALKTEDKDYRRVRLLRTLPLHRPFEYISVSDMDKNEIGIIKKRRRFPERKQGDNRKRPCGALLLPRNIADIFDRREDGLVLL